LSDTSRVNAPHRIVVKVGTRLVTSADGLPDDAFMSGLAAQIAAARADGVEVILVTSGAVRLGHGLMFGDARALMSAWARAFAAVGLTTAQVLLTQDDIVHRERCVNLRDTLDALLRRGIVPLLNENDSVSGVDTTFGENDNLAAMVAVALAPSDLLVYLQDQEGLLSADPNRHSGAELIQCVGPDDDLSAYATDAGGPESLGGMAKKLEGARCATDCGIRVVIAGGNSEGVLGRIMREEEVGTCLLPRPRIPSRKGWLMVHGRPCGAIVVDDGARRALLRPDGSSLLPSGIVATTGAFEVGDLVTVRDESGVDIARGLVNYSRAETDLIKGHHSSEIAELLGPELLGHEGADEVIHRDDLVLLHD